MAKKRFELVSGSSSKFWEIEQKGKTHTVTYGRIGSDGRSVTKEFESVARARNSAEILTEKKVAKGYRPAKISKKVAKKKKTTKKKTAVKKATRVKKAIRLPMAEIKKREAERAAKKAGKSSNKSHKQRHQLLVKKCGSRLEKSIGKLLPDAKAAIDFMMFYPPEEDGWISVLAEVDREEWPWDFQILKKEWALPDERKRNSTPKDLYPALLQLFQTAWKEAAAGTKISGFLRIHEDQDSVDLKSGKKIADNKRADIRANLFIRPYKKKKGPGRRKVKPTGLKLGWSVKKVANYLKTDLQPDEEHPAGPTYFLDDRGLQLLFTEELKLRGFNAEPPFAHSVDGVHLGMHVTDVEKVHGLPAVEEIWHNMVGRKKTNRRWEYPERGLYLSFSFSDEVLFLQLFDEELKGG